MVGESYKPVYAQGSLVHPVPLLDSPELDQQPGGWPTGSRRPSGTGPRR